MTFLEYIDYACGAAVIAFALFVVGTLGWFKKG